MEDGGAWTLPEATAHLLLGQVPKQGSGRPLFLPPRHGAAPAAGFPFHSQSLRAPGVQGRGLGEAGAAARGSLRSEQARWGVSGEGC